MLLIDNMIIILCRSEAQCLAPILWPWCNTTLNKILPYHTKILHVIQNFKTGDMINPNILSKICTVSVKITMANKLQRPLDKYKYDLL